MVSNEERARGRKIKNMDSRAGRPEDRHPATIRFLIACEQKIPSVAWRKMVEVVILVDSKVPFEN